MMNEKNASVAKQAHNLRQSRLLLRLGVLYRLPDACKYSASNSAAAAAAVVGGWFVSMSTTCDGEGNSFTPMSAAVSPAAVNIDDTVGCSEGQKPLAVANTSRGRYRTMASSSASGATSPGPTPSYATCSRAQWLNNRRKRGAMGSQRQK